MTGASKRVNLFPRFTTIIGEPIRSKSGQEAAVVCTRDRDPTGYWVLGGVQGTDGGYLDHFFFMMSSKVKRLGVSRGR